MGLSELWQRVTFLLVHVTNDELHVVLWATVLTAWRLAVVLEKHDDRRREAKLARRVAAGYACLSLAFWLAHIILS
ncbi:MAG: hypothetical protein P4N59_00930 [Negativicutes bacterium]|nr:hypothetical protein [Negativicutes bacterium]